MLSPQPLELRTLVATLRREQENLLADAVLRTFGSGKDAPDVKEASGLLRHRGGEVLERVCERFERGPVSKERLRAARGASASVERSARSAAQDRYVEEVAPRFWAHFRVALLESLSRARVRPSREESCLMHVTIDESLARFAAEARERAPRRRRKPSKRRFAEPALAPAEAHVVLESIPDGVYVGTRAGFSCANPRGLSMLGLGSVSELATDLDRFAERLLFRDVETGDRIASSDLSFARALDGETSVGEILVRRADDGEDVVLRSSAAPIRDRGRVVGAVVVNTDVTEDHRARKRLREEMELIDRFIGILGHDLRNPLNAIASGAELLARRGDLTQGQRRIVERVVSSSHRMARIIEQLLDWTRSRRGGIPIERVPVNLRTIVTEVVAELEAAHPSRSIRVESRGDLDGSWDGDRVAQAVSNLVGNAVVHSPVDEPVKVTVSGTEAAGVIEIHNGGAPIDPDVLPSIFAPFRRVDFNHAVGLGLGLYIVRAIALAHGGTADVESTRDRGTTFRLVLPREP